MRRLIGLARRHPDASAALTLFLLPFAVHAPAFVPGRVLSPADHILALDPWKSLAPGLAPANPLLTDVAFQLHPSVLYAAGEVAAGRFPLWNPHVFAGAPFLANPTPALLFPLTALAYVLPAVLALTLMSVLKCSAAGLGMHWFLRGLGVGPLAAFTGALAFMLSAPFVVWLQYPIASAMIFLPLLCGAVERARERADPRRVLLLGLVVAAGLVAGYPQVFVLGLLVAGAWALCRLRGAAGGLRFLARVAAGVALGVALAGVQVVPFIEYLGESAVWAYRSQWVPALHAPPRSAILLLMPHYHGSAAGGDYWGAWNFNETAVSVGLLPWAVLPVTLLGARQRKAAAFFAGLAFVAGAMYYGLPGLSPILAAVPGATLFARLRFSLPLAFALSALCAIGLDAAGARPQPATRRAALGVKGGFVLLAAVALLSVASDHGAALGAGMRVGLAAQYLWFLLLLTLGAVLVLRRLGPGGEAPRWGLALAGVELASLLPLALGANPATEGRWLYPATPAIRHLQEASARDHGRVLLQMNIPMLYGLSEATGYDGMTPRRIERLVRPGGTLTLGGHGTLAASDVLRSPALDLLGIRRLVVAPGAAVLDPRFALEYDGADARVYRNERALPRAFLVPRGRCVGDEAALRLIWRGAVESREEVLLAGCLDPPVQGATDGSRRVTIREHGPHRVRVETEAHSAAYLVLTDTWFPGWRARVDGTEQPIWRADYALRALALGPGPHEIEFSYEPGSVRLGLAFTVAAGMVAAALAILPGRRPGRA